MNLKTAVMVLTLALVALGSADALARKKASKKKKSTNITKIIPKKDFTEALVKLAKDERVPVASSTLVEKGRGEDYYGVEKLFDKDLETFWAEGAKGNGKNEWVAFLVPDDTTHIEVVPGAGREQFDNFNRPRMVFIDYYQVKLKRDKGSDEYKPEFKWMARNTLKFKNKPRPVRAKVPVKLPELALPVRTMYVGVIILQTAYRGQFADTSVAEVKTSAIWGEL
ncbi:MAG: hypothetical protein JXR96_25415 [Deltaproteobacteria bacterium]|nr:hypothetical protein [Deltaproteobacteria bacterium]